MDNKDDLASQVSTTSLEEEATKRNWYRDLRRTRSAILADKRADHEMHLRGNIVVTNYVPPKTILFDMTEENKEIVDEHKKYKSPVYAGYFYAGQVCPLCRKGFIEQHLTRRGVIFAFVCFPFGFICCLRMRQWRCNYCTARFRHRRKRTDEELPYLSPESHHHTHGIRVDREIND